MGKLAEELNALRHPGATSLTAPILVQPQPAEPVPPRVAVLLNARARKVTPRVVRALSHVVPDPVLKVRKGQDPLHILGDGSQVRHDSYGGDLARGIRLAMESEAAVNDDFNLSTAASTTVLELAEAIWTKVHGDGRPFRTVSDPPFEHDVQLRVPDVRKAGEVLGFEATTSLDTMLDEVIPWIREELEAGRL